MIDKIITNQHFQNINVLKINISVIGPKICSPIIIIIKFYFSILFFNYYFFVLPILLHPLFYLSTPYPTRSRKPINPPLSLSTFGFLHPHNRYSPSSHSCSLFFFFFFSIIQANQRKTSIVSIIGISKKSGTRGPLWARPGLIGFSPAQAR